MANVAVHTISFRGLAGTIFMCLTVAAVLYVIGFSTPSWSVDGKQKQGLWEYCSCRDMKDVDNVKDWFHAVQAMITIGLIFLLLGLICACIYLCVHTISKNTTILALILVCFLGVLFMLIGFIIYGVKADHHSWSYAITILASIFTLVAGVLSVVQMRQSGVTM